MRAAHRLLDAGAGVNFIRSSTIPTSWAYHINRDGLLTLHTAPKQPSSPNRVILINLRIAIFISRVWLGAAPQLAAHVILGTAFIDRFVRCIFSSERKAIPWHSKPIAFATKPRAPQFARKTNLIANGLVSAAYRNRAQTVPVYDVVRVAKGIEQQPYTKHRALTDTQPYGILIIDPIDLSRRSTLDAHGVLKMDPGQPLYILVSNFPSCRVHLPN